MGGFEPKAKPWRVDPIPSTFQFELLDEDWDQFEVLMTHALHRTPCLETAEIKMLLNGPESFTPDGNFILGKACEVRNYFVCAGFNSAGIANSGAAGRLMAEWIARGQPPADLWDVDLRRFGAFTGNRRALAERTGETLGLHYAMRWPRQELETGRPIRTSLTRVSPDDLSPEGLKFCGTREIDLGFARVRAARMSYVGGPGFDLYVPVEMARHVYLALKDAGRDLGLRDAGYYALNALRIEQGRRAWGAELGPDETPWEAGLAFRVRLDKPADFIGKSALLAASGQPLRKKLVTLVFNSPTSFA